MCSCTPCIGADQSQLPTNLVVCCPHILYLRTFQRNKHRSRTAAAIDSMRVAPQKKKIGDERYVYQPQRLIEESV